MNSEADNSEADNAGWEQWSEQAADGLNAGVELATHFLAAQRELDAAREKLTAYLAMANVENTLAGYPDMLEAMARECDDMAASIRHWREGT